MTVLTATQATFDAQLAKLAPGDTLQVSGPFSGRPDGRKFSSPTTIDFRQAVVSDIYSAGWGGVTFLGGKGFVGKQWNTCLRIEASTNCKFSGFDIDGSVGPFSGYDSGLWLNGGSDLLAELIKVSGAEGSFRADGVTGLTLRSLEAYLSVEDAIKVADCSKVLIELNKLLNFKPRPGDHPDGIQIGSSIGKPVSKDITVQGNTISGPVQGIFVAPYDDGKGNSGLGFDNVNIVNNDVEAGMANGIMIAKCPTWAITDNRVKTFAGSQWQSVINTNGPGRKRNIVAAYQQPTGEQKPAIVDPDYVAPAPVPPPSPAPGPTPTPVPPATPKPAPAPKPKPRKVKVTQVIEGVTYTGTLTEKLA